MSRRSRDRVMLVVIALMVLAIAGWMVHLWLADDEWRTHCQDRGGVLIGRTGNICVSTDGRVLDVR